MDMHTTVLLVRTLMLVGILFPLIVGGIVLAIRDRYRVSKTSGDASPSPGCAPAFVSGSVTGVSITKERMRWISSSLA